MKDLEYILKKLDLSTLNQEEITYLSSLPEQLELIERDALTGVYNRGKFNQDLTSVLAGTDRTKRNISLIIIDIDYFKDVNDTYGHQAGDRVLKEVASTVQNTLRDHEKHNAYRYGGEEFAVLVPETNLKEGVIVAERIRNAIRENCSIDGKAITVSAGVSNYKEDCNNEYEFIERADKGLYQAKENGRDQVQTYEPNIEEPQS